MKKISTFIYLIFTVFAAFGQSQQQFGKIDIADLQLKSCEFEKDANAMVLFDKADVYFDQNFDIIMDRHQRIKIFNDKGKKEGDIRLEFYSGHQVESIYSIQAQTINLVNGKPEIIKVDKKLIYTQAVDKNNSAIVFSFPNVQPGSVLEFKYTWKTPAFGNFPDWEFQRRIPVQYSELKTAIPEFLVYRTETRVRQPYTKNASTAESKTLGSGSDVIPYTIYNQDRVLTNIPSLADEPYMTSVADNLQSIQFQLTSIRPVDNIGFPTTFADSWAKVGGVYADDDDFGVQIKKKLEGEELIINKAKTFKDEDQKIAYIFNEVKNRMKWDGQNKAFTNDGTPKAWDKKIGNSAEVNLILCHLLKQSGVKAYPMLASTRDHGKVHVAYPSVYQFNKAVVYIRADSVKRYILDATDKFNTHTSIPADILNSAALYFDKDSKTYDIIDVNVKDPIREAVSVEAKVLPDGKMEGTAYISSMGYNKSNIVRQYKTDGADKYKKTVIERDNAFNIGDFKIENIDVDSLPLMQQIAFNSKSSSADGDYIYINPNMFSNLKTNPFMSENRYTDIDFGYRNNIALNGNYKVPAGYTIDALPKSVSLNMPDNTITFRRVIGEQEGAIIVRCVIDFKKSIYFKEDYPYLWDFYKKMNELLNEQIVLKKS